MRAACGGVYSASRYTSRSMVLLVIHVSLVHEDRSRSDRLPDAARRASTDASSTSVGSGATSLAAHWDELARRCPGSVAPGEQIDGKRQPVVVVDKSVTRLTLLVPTRTQHLRESAAMIVGCTAAHRSMLSAWRSSRRATDVSSHHGRLRRLPVEVAVRLSRESCVRYTARCAHGAD
jgi:hypothetical protein